MGKGCQRVRPQPGWMQGPVGCSRWDLSGDSLAAVPMGLAPVGMLVLARAPEMQRWAPRGMRS